MSPIRKAQAVKEYGPHILYFNRTLFSHGNFTETERQRETGYASAASTDYVRPENQRAAAQSARGFPQHDDGRRSNARPSTMPWGTADEVAERIIAAAEQRRRQPWCSSALNRGAMPHEMFMNQIDRFAREVLPRLQAHEVKRVPAAEEAMRVKCGRP